MRYAFVGYDDPLYVENAHARQGLSPGNIRWAFELGPGHAGNFHPLTWLSHMLDFSLAGPRPGFHHAHNVLLHAAAAAALLLALYRATGALWPATVVAALFAWHPLHVQSVAWVAERKDVLSGLFFCLTLLAYVEYARRPSLRRYAIVFLLAAAAMLAKPMVVTLPAVLILLDYWPLGRRGVPWSRQLAEKLPLFAMSIAISVLTVLAQAQSGAIRTTENLPLSLRIANVPVSYARYLLRTAAPKDLAIFYPYVTWSLPIVICATLILLITTAIAIAQRRRRPYLIVGWLIFLGMLVPVIGIVQVGEQSIADRYTYLPLTGVFLMLCWAAPWTRGSALIAGVALAACFGATLYQLHFWKDDFTLFSRALEVTQDNYIAHGYVGKALAARSTGDAPAALAHYDRAIEIKPTYWESHYNRGNLLLRAGRTGDAIEAYRRAVAIHPALADGWNNLGIALAMQGKDAEAEESFAKAAAAAPDRPGFAANLARIRARRASSPSP